MPCNSGIAVGAHGGMTSNLDAQLTGLLNGFPRLRAAYLFGSLASGKARPDSDLDIAVLASSPLTQEEKLALIGELATLTGRPVDLVDLATVGEPLLGQVLLHGRRLLGSDLEHAWLIRRHVFEQADFVPYRNRILAERRRAWIGK